MATLSRRSFTLALASSVLAVSGATELALAQSMTGGTVYVYSGRNRDLVEPIFDSFTSKTGIQVLVRYGGTAELAAALLEEGDRTTAQVFFAQDAGALGALTKAGALAPLPESIHDRVDETYRAVDGTWVGVTGRARTLVYNTQRLGSGDVPESVMALTDPTWKGRIAWAPANGSFQAFVTGMRQTLGEEATEAWLRGMIENDAKEYPKNSAIVRAVGAGEVDLGLVNHYYLHRFLAEDPDFPAANAFTAPGDPGSLVNIAGCGVLKSSAESESARALIEFLLSDEAQRQFATQTHEYPLVDGVPVGEGLVPIEQIEPPALDLSDLDDLEGTLRLLREVGALP